MVNRYFWEGRDENIRKDKMLAILTLKNCATSEKYLKTTKNRKDHKKKFNDPGEFTDPFIRP